MITINNEYLLQRIVAQFAQKITSAEEPFGLLTIDLQKDQIVEVLNFLYHDEVLQMQFLTDICGVHYAENAPETEFAVVYHLHSLVNNIRLRLKCYLSRTDLRIATATPVFKAANWMERETFDFYGIVFENHPDLRRILNIDEMDYHPLRKEYALEDETRTDKDDRYFGREGNEGVKFDK